MDDRLGTMCWGPHRGSALAGRLARWSSSVTILHSMPPNIRSRSHSISFVHIQKDLLRTVGHCGRGNRQPAPQEILYRSNLGWCLARVRTKIGRDGNVGVFIEIVAESD